MQTVQGESDLKKIWRYWFYEWAEHEYPGRHEDCVWYQGTINRNEDRVWIESTLRPGVAAGYITMEYAELSFHMTGELIIVRFRPDKIIKEMSTHLKQEILFDHWLAMEEHGWTWTM